jgi:Aromatic-ring-opening dioxygenase LigAB, LigA subunit
MSVFNVNYLLRELLRDHAFRTAMKDNPAEALKKCDITEEERKLLLAGDVGGLHRLGVNDFLMGYLPRFGIAGLDPKAYGERISKEAPGAP